MNATTTVTYTTTYHSVFTAHIVKRISDKGNPITLCGRNMGGNAGLHTDGMPSYCELCPKCEAKSNA